MQLTGRIGKPMITLHGSLDALLPPSTDSDVYDRLVDRAGSGRLHRYYEIAGGTHTDNLYSVYPDRLRPLLPCARRAFRCSPRGSSGARGRPPTAATQGPRAATW